VIHRFAKMENWALTSERARLRCSRKRFYPVIFLCFSLPFLSCDSGCANEMLEAVKSPDGNLQAVIFRRDCGATTDYSTQVSIISANTKLPNKSGNVFVADTDHGKAPEQEGGGPKVKAEWLDNKSLRISYDLRDRVFLEEEKQSGISISYEKKQE
jgi:hypothetical protein